MLQILPENLEALLQNEPHNPDLLAMKDVCNRTVHLTVKLLGACLYAWDVHSCLSLRA